VTNFIPVSSAFGERILLRELNHRINNELASAINLVSVGAVLADNPEVKAALSSVVELLHKYADIHRALTIPDSDVLIDASEYLRRLGLAMSRSTLDRLNIHLVFAVDALRLESDRCWHLGLIVHELVINAARHASFDNGSGEIRVELTRSGASVNCVVADNGSASAAPTPGCGLRIVSDLSKILGGRIEHGTAARSRSILFFPLTERERRANRPVPRRSRAARPFKSQRALAQPSVTRQAIADQLEAHPD